MFSSFSRFAIHVRGKKNFPTSQKVGVISTVQECRFLKPAVTLKCSHQTCGAFFHNASGKHGKARQGKATPWDSGWVAGRIPPAEIPHRTRGLWRELGRLQVWTAKGPFCGRGLLIWNRKNDWKRTKYEQPRPGRTKGVASLSFPRPACQVCCKNDTTNSWRKPESKLPGGRVTYERSASKGKRFEPLRFIPGPDTKQIDKAAGAQAEHLKTTRGREGRRLRQILSHTPMISYTNPTSTPA